MQQKVRDKHTKTRLIIRAYTGPMVTVNPHRNPDLTNTRI
jgi:hypothetical protein